MDSNTLIASLNTELGITIPPGYSYDKIHAELAAYLDDLVNTDFEKLVTLLYRIDVPEQKLKSLLQQQPGENAGNIMATLVIEREVQKIRSREQYSSRDNDIDEAEKW